MCRQRLMQGRETLPLSCFPFLPSSALPRLESRAGLMPSHRRLSRQESSRCVRLERGIERPSRRSLPHIFQRNAASPAARYRCANASPAPRPDGHSTQALDAFTLRSDAAPAPSTMPVMTFSMVVMTIRNGVGRVADQLKGWRRSSAPQSEYGRLIALNPPSKARQKSTIRQPISPWPVRPPAHPCAPRTAMAAGLQAPTP